jgi:ubiquinol-cytochrome c reductase iron-sulfur subunit
MSDTPVDNSKRTWMIASGCAGAAGGIAARRPLCQQHDAFGKGQGGWRGSRGRYFRPQAGRETDRGVGVENRCGSCVVRPSNWLLCPSSTRNSPIPCHCASPERRRTMPRTDGARANPKSLSQWVFCTHLGCSPSDKFTPGPQPSLPNDWQGGFFCPCHGSTFDMAGRVYKNVPAPDNLEVPPYMFLSDSKLLIGEDKKA